MTRFVTKATPIDYIDSKCHNYKETEKQQDLFEWLFRLHITPLVIHGLGGGHTHTRIHPHRNYLNKPGAHCGQRAPGFKIAIIIICL